MDDVRRYTAPNGLEYKVVNTIFELYSQRRPDRIDELATMGVLEDMFHSDGSLNWDYINSEMSEDTYGELHHMQVFDELEDIEIELVPGAIWDVAYSEGLRHGQISAAEVLHRAYRDIWEETNPKTELYHYGMPRRSGRYPWGSGEDPYQHSGDFISRVQELHKQGMSEAEIAKAVGLENTTQLRTHYSNAINQRRSDQIARARSMLADGKSQAEVAREMGINESTLRSLLNERSAARTNAAQNTADFLRQQIKEKGMIDVGTGVERELGISREKLNQALQILQDEGYSVYGGGVPQVTNPGKQTNIKVLCPPGTEHKEIYDFENVHTITDYKMRVDENGEERFEKGFEYPASMDSDRLMIRYRDDIAPDGHTGIEKDGTIEIRRGVDDLDLGDSHYAQVRILVDGDKYMKGMAFYSDDMPDGVDVIFNTNKTPGQDVLKKAKTDDPNNPFGALIKEEGGQYRYADENGVMQLGLINKTRAEGDWGEWADALPSQFLSKQSMQLINKQLNLAAADKQAEFDEICSLTNPTVKKQLLETFANDCDSAAVHLQAAALPRQKYQVILPIATMKDDEVYAPNYHDGETVALIRYPHGGTFEIPILTVNNKQPDGRRILGPDAQDAIGINANVAARLSGADFDGDTVMVIPCNSSGSKVKITSTPPLKGLEGFDPKMSYGYSRVETDADGKEHYYRDGHEFKRMTKSATQMEMGKASNLITDMTLKGASQDELARAVRHSMVVIDAEKHKLDWKASEIDNGIPALKKKYQAHPDEDGEIHYGASTLISRAKSPEAVLKRKGSPKIDPRTGELQYKEVREEYTDKHGKKKLRTQDSTQMAEVKDARKLSSGTPQEEAYATYANRMKALANQARKEMVTAGRIKYSATAKETYRDEVDRMMHQLNIALKNAPRERQAQLAANSEVKAMKRANPDMTQKEVKKQGQLALSRARTRYGAQRHPIEITERGWQAIQAGAFSESTLSQILRFADIDQVRSYATPRATTTLSSGKQARIKAMRASGYTNSEIASALGISASTVSKYSN